MCLNDDFLLEEASLLTCQQLATCRHMPCDGFTVFHNTERQLTLQHSGRILRRRQLTLRPPPRALCHWE